MSEIFATLGRHAFSLFSERAKANVHCRMYFSPKEGEVAITRSASTDYLVRLCRQRYPCFKGYTIMDDVFDVSITNPCAEIRLP